MSQPLASSSATLQSFSLGHECALSDLLQPLIASSPIAVVALDANHRFAIANQRFYSLFGYTADVWAVSDFDEAITTAKRRSAAGKGRPSEEKSPLQGRTANRC